MSAPAMSARPVVATDLTRRFGLRLPVIQAPMAGGPTTAELVAGASEAGVLGALGAAYTRAQDIPAEIRAIRAKTDRPFAVNLFFHKGRIAGAEEIAAARRALEPLAGRVGAELPQDVSDAAPPLDAQIRAVLDEAPAALSFTMGLPPAGLVEAARTRGIALIGTATTPLEGRALIAAGVEMIVVQGADAGGHSGMFDADGPAPAFGWPALLEALVEEAAAAGVALIAAGGIMTGRGVAGALAMGAAGAQLGTAFLSTAEAGTKPGHRRLLAEAAAAGEGRTVLTRAFTARQARKLLAAGEAMPVEPAALAAFPAQHGLTRPIRARADAAGVPEAQAWWAGVGAGLSRTLPVAGLVERLGQELTAALEGMQQSDR